MNEMSKSHVCRLRHDDYKFIKGAVLDVGCGPDAIKLDPPSTVRGWDLADGDAQYLANIEDKSFDCVVSAHCLEHVLDPAIALKNWSRVLREGGYVYALVPLYSAYEKFHDFKFGSPHNAGRFNPDHKTSWDIVSVDKPKNHEHYDYKRIVQIGKDAGLHLVDLRMELDGFHWSKWSDPAFDSTMHGGLAQLCIIYQKI
jgi:SAM-dependent methyltransferase